MITNTPFGPGSRRINYSQCSSSRNGADRNARALDSRVILYRVFEHFLNFQFAHVVTANVRNVRLRVDVVTNLH